MPCHHAASAKPDAPGPCAIGPVPATVPTTFRASHGVLPTSHPATLNRAPPVNSIHGSLVVLALWPLLAGIPSCLPMGPPSGTYQVNTFEFVLSKPPQNVGESVPNIWIDTNTKLSGLSGGTLTSSLPCAVKIDYTDNSFSCKSAVFTSLKITYADNTVDPATDTVKLPLSINAREYESVNSVAGGRIVQSKSWIISGEISNLITRAEPFRLQADGYFLNNDDHRLPFSIDLHFDVKTEDSVKSAAELLQDK